MHPMVLMVAMAATVAAGTMECSKFKIDVPEGWTAKEKGKTIRRPAPSKAAAISIPRVATEVGPAKQRAQAMSAQLQGTMPVPDEGREAFTFRDKAGGQSIVLLFAGDEQDIVLAVTGAPNAA